MTAIRACEPPAGLALDEPDAHLVFEASGGEPRARCSLWWRGTPQHAGEQIGAIGHFSATDAASGAALLHAACRRLAAEGRRLAVGPMNGNTWRRYRAVLERGAQPPFFLEPDTAAHEPQCFADAGFTLLARYFSSAQEHLEFNDERLPALERRAAAAGIRIRAFERDRADRDLGDIHAVALRAFRRAFLFSPIDRGRFVAQYRLALAAVDPALVLIAERDGAPVGFLFGVPDALEAARGEPPRTAILKTVAVRPDRAYAGLGHLLVARAARAAAARGYRRTVHALMHEANSSLRWSARHGRVFRRYGLFARAYS